MAIITQADVQGRIPAAELIRLTDDAAAGTVNTTVLGQVIADGEGEVMNLIAQAYTVPLALGDANAAAAVKAMLLDVIVFRLLMRRMPVPEDAVTAYKAAMARAKEIATKVVGLVGETPVGTAPAGGGSIAIDASERVISREEMEGL